MESNVEHYYTPFPNIIILDKSAFQYHSNVFQNPAYSNGMLNYSFSIPRGQNIQRENLHAKQQQKRGKKLSKKQQC